MNKHILLIFLILLVGCTTVRLSPEGSRVRLVTSTPHNCAYVGNITSHISGVTWNGTTKNEFINELKNEAARMKANTVEMTSSDSKAHDVTGEAYNCTYN